MGARGRGSRLSKLTRRESPVGVEWVGSDAGEGRQALLCLFTTEPKDFGGHEWDERQAQRKKEEEE